MGEGLRAAQRGQRERDKSKRAGRVSWSHFLAMLASASIILTFVTVTDIFPPP